MSWCSCPNGLIISPRVKQQYSNVLLLLPGSNINIPMSCCLSSNIPMSYCFSQGQTQGYWDVPMGQLFLPELTTLQLVDWMIFANPLGTKEVTLGYSDYPTLSPGSSTRTWNDPIMLPILPGIHYQIQLSQVDYINMLYMGLFDNVDWPGQFTSQGVILSLQYSITLELSVACDGLVVELQELG